jgi:sugar phosphate isomerase/epimerase
MKTSFGLAALTVLELDPAEQISCAAGAGYDCVSVRLVPATPEEPQRDTIGETSLIRETKRRSDDLGLPVLDVETVRIRPDTTVKPDFEAILAAGALLDASAAVVAVLDTDRNRMSDNLAQFADLAHQYGMRTNIEFIPWTAVPDLATAAQVLRTLEHPSVGIVIDSLHFARSGSSPEDLVDIPAEWFPYMQLCDGPAESPATTDELIDQARNERQIPGHGGIDVLAPIYALPPNLPMVLEVPMRSRASVSADTRARDVLSGARQLLSCFNISARQDTRVIRTERKARG